MTERIPDPNTIAADWWDQLLADARALATMAMADQGITGITAHQSDLIDLGIAAGANAAMDLLRCKGVLR